MHKLHILNYSTPYIQIKLNISLSFICFNLSNYSVVSFVGILSCKVKRAWIVEFSQKTKESKTIGKSIGLEQQLFVPAVLGALYMRFL